MVKRPHKEDTLLPIEQQKNFRSGVGMILYLVKKSRFKIANSVRETSKAADGETIGHWKLVLRRIKYIATTEYSALNLKPNPKETSFDRAELEGASDSDFGADQETRISAYCLNLYSVLHLFHGNQRQEIVCLFVAISKAT
jgi:hypothetical protein